MTRSLDNVRILLATIQEQPDLDYPNLRLCYQLYDYNTNVILNWKKSILWWITDAVK